MLSVDVQAPVACRFRLALRQGRDDAVFAAIEEHHLRTHPKQHAASVVPRPKGERDTANQRHVDALTSPALAPLLAEAREYHRIVTEDRPGT